MLKYEGLPRELEFFPRGLTNAGMKRLGKTWGRWKWNVWEVFPHRGKYSSSSWKTRPRILTCIVNVLKSLNQNRIKTFLDIMFKVFLNLGENCSDCKKKLASGEPFYKDSKLDHPYCVECYSKKNAKVCNGCKKTIEHGDKNLTLCFHNECLKTFKCHICSKILDVNEQVFSKDDKFSCSKCHWN